MSAHQLFMGFPRHSSHEAFRVLDRRQDPMDTFMDDLADHWIGFRPVFGFHGHPWLQRSTSEPKPEKWVHRLRLRGYNPDEVKVTVVDDKVLVHAKHVEEDDDNLDGYESKRTIAIPENVDTDKISSFMNQHNILVLQAPFVEKKEKKQEAIEIPVKAEVESIEHTTDDADKMETQQEAGAGDQEVVIAKPDEGFHLDLELERFAPENIQVLHTKNSVVVKGEQKKEKDGVSLTEHYFSEYSLPKNVDPDKIRCTKTRDGKLKIAAPYEGEKQEAIDQQ